MQNKLQPPPEVVAKAEEINKQWLTDRDARVEYYNQSSHRHNWRFRIVDVATKDFLIEHLSTEVADGHTYRMIESAIRAQREKGFEEGRSAVIVKQMLLQAKQLNINTADLQKTLAEAGL